MSSRHPRPNTQGPFLPAQLQIGGDYELSHGHPVYCAPTGGDGTGPNGRGFLVLDTDPLAANAGVDLGMQLGEYTMRAPDVAVGAFDEKRGWVKGALPLAVEYAAAGQDEADLQERVEDLLAHGVRYVWVVRLVGPRRVEVHERGAAVRTALPGQTLAAPGVLQNAVPVEALRPRRRPRGRAPQPPPAQGLRQPRRRPRGGRAPHAGASVRAPPRAPAHRRRARRAEARLASDGHERVADAVLDLAPDALADYLTAR
ncbi:MAG: Uma2 family endonuclease [Polyangiales bacterium]